MILIMHMDYASRSGSARNRGFRLIALAWIATCFLGCGTGPEQAPDTSRTLRIATFNTALSRDKPGALQAALATGNDKKAKLVAEVLQRTRPDVVLLQEIDFDVTGQAYADFQANYLMVSQNGAEPIRFEYIYATHVNTGVLAAVDLDGDGKITRPSDAYGYGLFEGQYGMVILSNVPFQTRSFRGIRSALWRDIPGVGPPKGFFTGEALSHVRLSSKVHSDVAVVAGQQVIHLLASHPTPPVFDGPEDRNGRRNYDEIGLWLHYLDPPQPASQRTLPFPRLDETHPDYPSDVRSAGTSFVILGDLNADPSDGESRPNAVRRLLDHPRINSKIVPTSEGAAEASRLQRGTNLTHKTDPATDTADWNDHPQKGSGNLRVDYVLPSKTLDTIASGVYWPIRDDPHAYLNAASDHKLVWIDIAVAPD